MTGSKPPNLEFSDEVLKEQTPPMKYLIYITYLVAVILVGVIFVPPSSSLKDIFSVATFLVFISISIVLTLKYSTLFFNKQANSIMERPKNEIMIKPSLISDPIFSFILKIFLNLHIIIY